MRSVLKTSEWLRQNVANMYTPLTADNVNKGKVITGQNQLHRLFCLRNNGEAMF